MQQVTSTAKKTSITSTASGLASSCILIPKDGGTIIIQAPDWSGSKALTLYAGYDPNDADSFEPLIKDDGEEDSYTVSGSRALSEGGFYLSFSLANPGTGATLFLCEPFKTYAP